MTSNENRATEMNLSQINKVIDHIQVRLKLIWLNARHMQKEAPSEKQTEYLHQIIDAEHRAYWMLRDLPMLLPQEYQPVTPNPYLTKLADVEKEFIGSYRNRDIGTRLLQDAPDFLDLTLGYRDLFDVVYISHRLLFILEKLQEQGAEISFQSTTEQTHQCQIIRIQIDCLNEDLLLLDEDLFIQIPLPYQNLDCGPYSISGLEFMRAKQYLVRIGGDFFAGKQGNTLKLTLAIPTYEIATETTKNFK